ncbi:hypothetical protein PR003_g19553 [Phytophthora rubi]|uniref:Uncharacterized protein n=1 Tax=Phytophthora rubi TaxID=129364 RepID=A0A6A3JRU6_9STRA|nr:hypothetical protein PR002_g19976 [Phytophthora rubi]KAE9003421.1 hypothetical protein PR001_g17981 [Phytophthora rubi]KAE9313233.1 hypothetical protein PR003_g19553 [Phytophthora rubi]
MPHAIAQAQGAIRAVGAALGFDSNRPEEAAGVAVPQPSDEGSSGAPAVDIDAPSPDSASPSEDASTEVLSSPVVTPSSSAGVPSSPTSVPASAHGASDEPQAAGAAGAPVGPASGILAPEAASGRAGQAPPTPVRPLAGGAVLNLAPPSTPSSPRQRCQSPVSPPNSPHDPSRFCRTNSRYAVPPVEPVSSARESASAYALEGVVQDASDSAVRRLEAFNERYFTNLAHLMVGLVRCPPLRVDPDLDRRLEGAHDLDIIVHAVAPGANTPPANWDTEMEILRVDVRYHREQLRECEKWLYKETDLRRQAESLCASISNERNEAVEEASTLREERDEVTRQAALAAVSLQKSADIIDLLKARIGKYDKKLEEARKTVRNDRLKIKKGLSDLTSCLKTFRQYLEARQRDRESGCLVDHGTDTTLPEGFQTLLDQVRSIQLHPTETSAGSKRPATSSAAAAHADREADSSSDESSEDSDVVFVEPPPKRRKGSSTSPKSKKKRASSHSASKVQSPSRRKSRLGKPSVDLPSKSSPSTAEGANSAPPPGHTEVSSGVVAELQGAASDQSVPVAPPPSALPAVAIPSSTAGCTPPPSTRRPETSAASLSLPSPPSATPSVAKSARDSPFEAAVVIPPRRDGRPVRPASTVASLQSKSAVERENAPDAVVIGSNPSASSSSARSVAGQDAGDGFVYSSQPMTFETMVIGSKARASKPAKAAKGKSAKAKPSKVAKPPKAVKPPRVVKHSVPSRKPSSSPSSCALRPEGSPPSRNKPSSTKTPKKHSDSASQVLDPPFTAPGAKECWTMIMEIRVPKSISVSVLVQCSVDGIKAFANWTDPEHPYQRLLASLPDEPCLFDASEFMPDKTISIRAAGVAIVVKLWGQFRGKSFGPTEKDDLGFALYERGHWVATASVERWLQQLAAILGETSSLFLAILAAWTEYARDRNACADRLRLQIPKRLWTWCLPDADGEVSCSPEVLFEPSILLYSLEPLPWTPVSADWVKEVLAVDGHEPWRNCWVDVPAAHPYNTSFAPCNPKAPLFVPTGFNFQQVASAVQVDSSLDPCDVTAQWVQDYTDYHGPRPASETEEEDDEVLSEGDLSDASAAGGSSEKAASKHSSLSHTPPVQDDGGAGAEEADDSAGSAAEDEESPDESASKPPRAAIRLDVLATVATTSK